MNKTITVGLGVAVVILGVLAFKVPTAVPVPGEVQVVRVNEGGSAPIVNIPEQKAPIVNVTVPKQEFNAKLGAVSSLDSVDNPYMNINGVQYYHYKQNIAATSSTICSLNNPFPLNKRYEIISYSADVTANGIAVAQKLTLGTSTDAYLTPSGPWFMRDVTVGTGAFTVAWGGLATTTSPTYLWGNDKIGGDTGATVGPSERLNLRISSTTPGTFASYYTGTCSALLKQL